MKTALRIWQVTYCDNASQYQQCARFRLSKKGEAIPDTLLSNGKSLSS